MGKSTTYQLAIKIAGKIDPSLKKALSQTGGLASSMLKGVGAAAIAATTAAVAFGVKSVASAAQYEKELSNIETLLLGVMGDNKTRMAQLSAGILNVSNSTGIATSELTDAEYQIISALGDSKDALGQLEVAAKAAKAGNATTTDSINLLTAVTKGYNDTSAEAMQKASDLAFKTMVLGQTTFPELASAIGAVVPVASALGVQQEELWGAMATLTGVTGNTDEVATQLKSTFNSFISPTTAMQKAMEGLGYSQGDMMLQELGLQGSLNALKDSVGGNEIAFANLFGNIRARVGVLSMAGAQSDNLTAKTQAMYDVTGATNAAYAAQTDNLAYTIQMIKNLGANFMTSVGMKILPYVRQAAEELLPKLQTAIAWFFDVGIPGIQNGIGWIIANWPTLAVILATIAAAIVAFKWGSIVKGVKTAMLAFRGFFTVLKANPVGLIITAIGLLVAAFIYLWNNCEGFRNFFINAWAAIKNAASVAVEWFTENILPGILAVWDNIKAIFGGVVDFITGVFTGNWSLAWQGVVDMFGGIIGTLTEIFKAPINGCIKLLNWFIGKLNGISIGPLPNWGILGEYAGATVGFNVAQIEYLAQGGIVTRPTMAMIGEGGEPEAVTPLSKLTEMLGGPGGATYVFSPNVAFPPGTSREEADGMMDELYAKFVAFMERYKRQQRRVAF